MAELRFVSIGRGHIIRANSIWAVVKPNTNQNQRIMAKAKKDGMYIDFTNHRPTKSVIIMDDGTVIGCMFSVQTIFKRLDAVCYGDLMSISQSEADEGVQGDENVDDINEENHVEESDDDIGNNEFDPESDTKIDIDEWNSI